MEGSTNPSFVSDQRKPSGKSGFIFRIIHFLIFTNYFFLSGTCSTFSKAKGDKPRNCLVPRAEAKLLKSPQSPQSSELHLRFETGKGPDPEITTKKGQSSVQ